MKLPYGYVLAGKEITAHEEKTDAESKHDREDIEEKNPSGRKMIRHNKTEKMTI